jgi:hypothetical protein
MRRRPLGPGGTVGPATFKEQIRVGVRRQRKTLAHPLPGSGRMRKFSRIRTTFVAVCVNEAGGGQSPARSPFETGPPPPGIITRVV